MSRPIGAVEFTSIVLLLFVFCAVALVTVLLALWGVAQTGLSFGQLMLLAGCVIVGLVVAKAVDGYKKTANR